jgi:protein-S-isoprenylcysteine O-methyltransferase Ste14
MMGRAAERTDTMRFKRSDIPGMVVAVVGPVALFFVLLESYQLWSHHGSPILGILSVHLAIGGGLLGGFARFIKARDTVLGLLGALVLCIVGVLGLQASGNDDTIASILKILGIIIFLILNVVVVWQILVYGLNPILVRRDERAAAAQEQA